MVIKKFFSKAKTDAKADIEARRKAKNYKKKKKKNKTTKNQKAKMSAEEAPNRFLRFYYANRRELLAERKEAYYKKAKKGICVRCNKKAVSGIKYCKMHQEKQREYNRRARENRAKK